MKAMDKLRDYFFRKPDENLKRGKEDTLVRYNSTAFFLVSIIALLLLTALVAETKFKTKTYAAINNKQIQPEAPFYIDLSRVIKEEPKPVVKIPTKPVAVKKNKQNHMLIDNIMPVKPIGVDNPIVDSTPATDGDTAIHTDTPEPVVPTDPVVDNSAHPYVGLEQLPVFPGCEYLTDQSAVQNCLTDKLHEIIQRRFDKEIADRLGMTGIMRIYVNFVIDKKGNITDVRVRAPHPQLEREAIRVTGFFPRLTPGRQNGSAVNVMYSLPIMYEVK